MTLLISVVGISHKTAPAAVREAAAFTPAQKLEAFRALAQQGVTGCVIVSTCNRSEIYCQAPDEAGTKAAFLLLNALLPSENKNCLYSCSGGEAIRHLFEVAAGLDSMVVGEDQIIGQLQEAVDFSLDGGFCPKHLHRVFLNAFACAKAVKTRFKISEQPVSVCYMGVKLLQQLHGLQGENILLAGSGKTAELALRYLCAAEPRQITMACRRAEAAEPLKSICPTLRTVPFEKRYEALEECGVLVSATASPHCVFDAERLSERSKPLMILDLALPRDVEPSAAGLPGVQLIDIDTLQKKAEENLQLRQTLAEQAKEEIDRSVAETQQWLANSAVDEGIEALSATCSRIEAETLHLLCAKLGLTGHDARLAGKILHHGFHRLQNGPILALKGLEDPESRTEYSQMVARLFGDTQNEE